jgi:hypothetical protein
VVPISRAPGIEWGRSGKGGGAFYEGPQFRRGVPEGFIAFVAPLLAAVLLLLVIWPIEVLAHDPESPPLGPEGTTPVEEILVEGREDSRVGIADSASEGAVGASSSSSGR